MYFFKQLFFKRAFGPILFALGSIVLLCPNAAQAHDWAIVDSLNLAPFVPMILDALMKVAKGGYDFFVGNGTGGIYILVWGFLTISLAMYLLKLYFPKIWVSFFGFSGGGDMAAGKVTAASIATNMLKPALRAIIAVTILLQIKPVFITEYLVNPFLEFGAIYTQKITNIINTNGGVAPRMECPQAVVSQGWISESSCEFLVQPISDVSYKNNQIVKRGFDFFERGLRGLVVLYPHDDAGLMDVITGIILVITFVGCNLFMAMLIIQAIFNFGMALILYPFQVLTYVVKPNDKWFDIWPAFSGITKALQDLLVTMIACAFILCVNVAVVQSLFRWGGSVFVAASGGTATSNVPHVASDATGFGQHFVLWLSAILTFFLMQRIFTLTQEQLKKYTGSGMDKLYNQVKSDTEYGWNKAKEFKDKAGGVKGIATSIGKGAVNIFDGVKNIGGKVVGWFR